MNHNALFYIKRISLILLSVVILVYSLYQVRNIIVGPSITMQSPLDGQTYLQKLITVSGKTTNTNYLTLNDRQIFTDAEGNFTEKIVLAPGLNTLKIYAENKFGKKMLKILYIILQSDISNLPIQIKTDNVTESQVANPLATSTISTTSQQ